MCVFFLNLFFPQLLVWIECNWIKFEKKKERRKTRDIITKLLLVAHNFVIRQYTYKFYDFLISLIRKTIQIVLLWRQKPCRLFNIFCCCFFFFVVLKSIFGLCENLLVSMVFDRFVLCMWILPTKKSERKLCVAHSKDQKGILSNTRRETNNKNK